MFCSKCGTQINPNERFCSKCGILVVNANSPQSQQTTDQIQSKSIQAQPNTNVINQGFGNNQNNQPNNITQEQINQVLNPNMKKWAILSIVLPAVGIGLYIWPGLSIWIAIAIAGAGLEFAKKGKMGNPKLAKIGQIVNYILLGIALIMLILLLISVFSK